MAKNWDYAAGIVWPVLTERAAGRKTITYQEIAPTIGTNPLSVGRALGPIQDYCLEARLPPLTSIVIGKNSKVPGPGFIAWDVDDLEAGQRQVFDFGWWAVGNPYGAFKPNDSAESLAEQLTIDPGKASQVYAIVRVRGVAQRVFKAALMKAYDSQCAFCGLSFDVALQGCHILPWGKSSHAQRLDPRNGLLLCSSHHSLFDNRLMTISRSFNIVYRDMTMEWTAYSKSDKALTISLAGKRALLPNDCKLWPSRELLQARHKLDEWEDLA